MDTTAMMGFLISAGILFQRCDADVKCRDDNGNEVDWYILYKFPKRIGDGLSYMYMDESTNGWRHSTETINSNSGTLAYTLKPLLDFYIRKTEGFGYLLYNDQPPNSYAVSASFGHSKGIVMLDKQTGVWLSHSTPKFPTYQQKNFWPNNGNDNAQIFMCVSYAYDQFREIALQLKYIHAYSYDYEIPKTFHTELKCVADRSCYPKKAPWSRGQWLTSVTGHKFLSLAKYTRFADDLYSGLVANYAKETLYVKSWGKMRRPLKSNCSINYHVINVKDVKLLDLEAFSNTVDHSKWCATQSGLFTCIADMNREMSQMARGGGAICTNNAVIGKAFYDMIETSEECSSSYHNEL
ncbi:deoxyribonuclease-2-beta-like [Mugil cephalus]|uniref:deoxyribonuclease-2-beta-like n=1 Tax=Mugil cephalus TaxID=48193 RepID=UPI001FB82279|nr:deoxyribonuclease-2-beta-like [Mugil cephalus]